MLFCSCQRLYTVSILYKNGPVQQIEKPAVAPVTLWPNATVNTPLKRKIVSMQRFLALCSCLLPEFCPLWESWSLTLHGLSPFLFPPSPSLSLSRPLLTILSAFLALSSLLIYRIMHQKSLWGVAVMQAAAPSGFALFLTTIFDQLEAPHHVFSLLQTHKRVQSSIRTDRKANTNTVSQINTALFKLKINNMPAVNVTLPQLSPSWKQTAKDTTCCVSCEITCSLGAC